MPIPLQGGGITKIEQLLYSARITIGSAGEIPCIPRDLI